MNIKDKLLLIEKWTNDKRISGSHLRLLLMLLFGEAEVNQEQLAFKLDLGRMQTNRLLADLRDLKLVKYEGEGPRRRYTV